MATPDHHGAILGKRIIAIALWLWPCWAFAQDMERKCVRLPIISQPILLDSLSALPSSIHIFSNDSLSYQYDLSSGMIAFEGGAIGDSATVCFQPIPVSFHHSIYSRSLAVYDSNAYFKDKPSLKNEDKGGIFRDDKISKSGSIVRNVSAGANRDMVVNSTMDISLEGKLNDRLNIQAQITDQDIPYQAEGNTQYVQDIDHVFIRIYNDRVSLTAGDVTLKNPIEGFLKYSKRTQGGLLQTDYLIGKAAQGSIMAAVSAAKGKFATATIEPQEGVSGPYKIRAQGNERILFIIANTEKVFLDGKQLERGYDRDYVIDYNQSEITFTAKVMITRHSRLRIDFEYADRNYSRSIVTASNIVETKRANLFINFYQEKDNPERPLSPAMTEETKRLLADAGDGTDILMMDASDSVGFHENEILYKRIILDGREIFQFSTHPDSAVYRVRFTNVGKGRGDYTRLRLAGNGWIYQYAEPVNGNPAGDYAAGTAAPAPSGKRMVSAGGSLNLNRFEKAFAEIAFSNNDLNLFSALDGGDDNGAALKIGIQSVKRKIKEYELSSEFLMESLGKHFSPIDRYRSVEYDRQWIEPQSSAVKDLAISFNSSLSAGNENYLKYSALKRTYGSGAGGLRHGLQAAKSIGRGLLRSGYLQAGSEDGQRRSKWTNVDIDASYLGPVIPGYSYRLERNIVTHIAADSIIASDVYFNEHTFYVKSSDSAATNFKAYYSIRNDREPFEGELSDFGTSHIAGLQLSAFSGKSNSIKSSFAYHKTRRKTNAGKDGHNEFISGSLFYSGSLLGGAIQPELAYSLSNGRELKREYIYMRTLPGQGFYTWIDGNNDGVQDLNEFFVANYEDEKNFVRIYAPTDEYITAFGSDLRFTLKYEPPSKWRDARGVRKFLSAFSGNTIVNAQRKTTSEVLFDRLSPFGDGGGLSHKFMQRHQLWFNRAHPLYGFEIEWMNNSRRQLLTSGYEETIMNETRLTGRINAAAYLTLRCNVEQGSSGSESDFLSNRNFTINRKAAIPELEWMAGRNLRIIGKLSIAEKTSRENEEKGRAIFKSASMDASHHAKGKAFSAGVRFVRIEYLKPASPHLEYEMLEALRKGKNVSWRLSVRQDLASYLTFDLNYEGRKPEGTRSIHFGRVQLTAWF